MTKPGRELGPNLPIRWICICAGLGEGSREGGRTQDEYIQHCSGTRTVQARPSAAFRAFSSFALSICGGAPRSLGAISHRQLTQTDNSHFSLDIKARNRGIACSVGVGVGEWREGMGEKEWVRRESDGRENARERI